jgi:hypothetical protein
MGTVTADEVTIVAKPEEQVERFITGWLETGDTFQADGKYQCGNRSYFSVKARVRGPVVHSPLSDQPVIGSLRIAGNTTLG